VLERLPDTTVETFLLTDGPAQRSAGSSGSTEAEPCRQGMVKDLSERSGDQVRSDAERSSDPAPGTYCKRPAILFVTIPPAETLHTFFFRVIGGI